MPMQPSRSRQGQFRVHMAIVMSSVMVAGCAANEPAETSQSVLAGKSVYPISSSQAHDVLKRSVYQSFAGSRIRRLRTGYRATLRVAVDRHYISAVMEPAAGKKANGERVAGFIFRVYDRGTILISGPIRARRLRERIHREARLITAPVQYAGPSTRPSPTRRGRRSSGSGFVINASGDVLTNNHVAGKCDKLTVRLQGRDYSGNLLAQDVANDLAVVRFAGIPIRTIARLSARRMRLGGRIVALGFPLTTILGKDLKATTGNISGLSGLGNNSAFFQFTAPIQPGNSGGPIVDETGAIAGIAQSKLRAIKIARRTGSLSQLVNFGVKSRTARGFLSTHRVPFTVSRTNRTLSTVDVVSNAEQFTVLIKCN